MLSRFFGKTHVIPKMSVLSVCGGNLPGEFSNEERDWTPWARENRCLFTVVDHLDEPKMVVEFFSGFKDAVVAEEVEHQKYLKPLLSAANISYVTISDIEFSEVLDPQAPLDFCSLLQDKIL